MQGAVAAMGAPLVGLTAEWAFGFKGLGADAAGGAAANAAALGSALLVRACVHAGVSVRACASVRLRS